MKKRLFLQVLVLAFLFVMASCGDDDSDFIARGDGSSLEEDSSDSDGDDGSSSSKKGSSSSSSTNGSSSSSGSSSSRAGSSSSDNVSSSSYSSGRSSSSSSASSSSSIAYEDIPGKVITGVYQGFIGHVVMPTIEVRALTNKMEYVDSTVSYEGMMDSSYYRFNVRGLLKILNMPKFTLK